MHQRLVLQRADRHDTCGNATITIVSTVTNFTGHCGNTFDATRTWRATDGCGNFAECSQTVTLPGHHQAGHHLRRQQERRVHQRLGL